jgi:cell shape-determining protein MreC
MQPFPHAGNRNHAPHKAPSEIETPAIRIQSLRKSMVEFLLLAIPQRIPYSHRLTPQLFLTPLSMAKILLIVAAVASLGTAVLGYFNKQKLSETAAALAQTETTLSSTKSNLAKNTKDLTDAKQSIETLTAEAQKAQADLATAQADAQKAGAALTDAKGALDQKTSEVESLTAQVAEKDKQIEELSKGTPPPAQGGGDDAEKQELTALVASLTQKNEQLESQVGTLQEEKKNRMELKMREGLEGRVLAVNPAWNFVVLSIGDKNGVVNNSELLLKRGGQYLGRVRVTAVEPSTSIADIMANSLPSGVSVQPGDSVIYQSSTN